MAERRARRRIHRGRKPIESRSRLAWAVSARSACERSERSLRGVDHRTARRNEHPFSPSWPDPPATRHRTEGRDDQRTFTQPETGAHQRVNPRSDPDRGVHMPGDREPVRLIARVMPERPGTQAQFGTGGANATGLGKYPRLPVMIAGEETHLEVRVGMPPGREPLEDRRVAGASIVQQVTQDEKRRRLVLVEQPRKPLERKRSAAGRHIQTLGPEAQPFAEVKIGHQQTARRRLEDGVLREQFEFTTCEREPHAPRSACASIRAIRSPSASVLRRSRNRSTISGKAKGVGRSIGTKSTG